MKAYGLLAALLCIASSAVHAGDVTVSHFEKLQRLELRRTVMAAAQPPPEEASADVEDYTETLTFDALSRSFELQLKPNHRLLTRAARRALPEGIALYRGRLAGKDGSWTRIVISNGVPQGLIWDGEQMFAIEAPEAGAVSSTSPMIYRLADTHVAPGTMSCGAARASASGASMYAGLVGELSAATAKATGANSEIRVSAIGDYEFTNRFGPTAATAIAARLNNVDGIFSEQLGVQITVDTIETFTDPEDDPFTDTTDSDDLLEKLGFYRRDTPLHNSHGLTHLYTGQVLDETTVGIAYLDALCHPRFGAGLSEGRPGTLTFDSLIAAHEIGHNFGAPHDAEEGSDCEAEPDTFLMAANLNGSDQFSQCSIEQIQPRIAAASCIASLPTVDITVSLDGTLSEVPLDSDETLNFEVMNVGTEPASNVAVEISLPDNMTLNSVSPAASCTSGAGLVDCQLGDMAGGGLATITLETTATSTGSGAFVATVTADADDNAANNQETVQFTVVPSVDLVVNAPGGVQVNVDQSTSVSIDLENLSALGATGVELSVSLINGLQANSASWPLGSCTVAAQQVDCGTDDFAAQSATILDINLTGTTAGQRSYTVSLSSTEADSNSANNSATGAVTVNAVATGTSDDGGGGSLGLLFLSLLSLRVAYVGSRHRY